MHQQEIVFIASCPLCNVHIGIGLMYAYHDFAPRPYECIRGVQGLDVFHIQRFSHAIF
jgi:hypothetical protein